MPSPVHEQATDAELDELSAPALPEKGTNVNGGRATFRVPASPNAALVVYLRGTASEARMHIPGIRRAHWATIPMGNDDQKMSVLAVALHKAAALDIDLDPAAYCSIIVSNLTSQESVPPLAVAFGFAMLGKTMPLLRLRKRQSYAERAIPMWTLALLPLEVYATEESCQSRRAPPLWYIAAADDSPSLTRDYAQTAWVPNTRGALTLNGAPSLLRMPNATNVVKLKAMLSRGCSVEIHVRGRWLAGLAEAAAGGAAAGVALASALVVRGDAVAAAAAGAAALAYDMLEGGPIPSLCDVLALAILSQGLAVLANLAAPHQPVFVLAVLSLLPNFAAIVQATWMDFQVHADVVGALARTAALVPTRALVEGAVAYALGRVMGGSWAPFRHTGVRAALAIAGARAMPWLVPPLAVASALS